MAHSRVMEGGAGPRGASWSGGGGELQAGAGSCGMEHHGPGPADARIEEEWLTEARMLVAPTMAGDTARQTDLISLSVADPMSGETLELGGADETAVVVLAGAVEVPAGSKQLGRAGGRRDVFEAAGRRDLRSARGDPPPDRRRRARVAGHCEHAARRRRQRRPKRGSSRPPTSESPRSARTTGSAPCAPSSAPSIRPGRLLLGETINPPGNWSSYPPHKHDTHEPPREVRLEEVYLFKVDPPGGFGVQLRYGPDGESALQRPRRRRGRDPFRIPPGRRRRGLPALLPVGDGRRGPRDDPVPRSCARLGPAGRPAPAR